MADNTIHGPNYQPATKSLKLDKKSSVIQQQQQQQQSTTNVNAGLNPPTTTTSTTSSNSPNQGIKKKTSFQITSVTVGSSRLSNDGGDDSADDLDESHTDDISRITDNETPSFSEDTLSRDEVVSNVIPTSAQYGLAILPEQVAAAATLPVVHQSPPIATTPTTTTVTTTTTTILPPIAPSVLTSSVAPVTSVKSAPETCIPTTLIPTSTQQTSQSAHQFDNSINQDLPVSYESVDSILEELVNNNQLNGLSSNSSPLKVLNTSSRSTDSTMITADAQPTRSERFKVVKIESTEPFRRGRWMCMDYLDHSVNQPHNSPFVKPVDSSSSLLNGGTASPAPPQTLPVPVQMQNGGTQHHPATITYQPVHQSPVNQQPPSEMAASAATASAVTTSAITTTATSPTPIQQGQTYSGHPIVSSGSSVSSTGGAGIGTQAQTYAGQQIQSQLPVKVLYENELVSSSSSSGTTMDRPWSDLENSTASLMAYMQNTSQVSPSTTMVAHTQSAPSVLTNTEAAITSATLTRTPSLNNIVIATNTGPISTVGALSPTIPMEPSHELDLANRILPLTGAVAGAVTSSSNSTPADPLAPSNPSLQVANFQPAPDDESASAASTVAIDNKIEQAMDLVKSHLMFAVREEVEVLKEKISELMDRINQLEVENSILKANATPDVLQQLPSPGTVIYTNPIPTTSVSTIVKSTPTSAS